jgi:cell division protease FtsH
MQTPEDNNNQDDEQNRPHLKSGWLYIIAIIFIGIFLYLIIQQYSNSGVVQYKDADIASTDGTLYKILNEGDIYYVNEEDHKNIGKVELEGYYFTDAKQTSRTHFTAVFSDDTSSKAYTNYYTIITTRTTSDGKAYFGAANNKYFVVDYTTKTSWTDYLPTIILWVVIIGVAIWLVSRLSKSMGSMNSQQFNFNSSRAKRETHSKVRFKDVAGCDEVKAELSEMVDYFRNSKKYTKLGAKLPKGILLQGPPGTGKTLLAKAVAGEADVPFYSISGSDFVEMYVGVGAGRVRDMFRIAKQNAPCLIFIDEIDAVGRQRGAGLGGGNDEREQTLNQLLVEMDGFEENSGVIVMAATNRSDILDPALLRAGRFDRTITVDLPDKEGREAILKVHARNKIMSPSVDFGAIASRTVGFSGADLANILNDAAILAVREKREAIEMDDIDEAIDRSIAGPAKTNRGMTAEEKKRVAYHEAGHAVIGIRLQHSEKVQRITIIPRGRTGGHVLMTPENDRYLLTKSELLAQITGLLGGRTSEEIFFGDISTGASNDIEQATEIAREMVTVYGMSDLGPIQYEKNDGSVFLGRDYSSAKATHSEQIALEIDRAVREIVDEAHKDATELLNKYKDDVDLVAKTLIDRETITAEQIDYLLEHREMPPKAPAAPIPPAGTASSAPAAPLTSEVKKDEGGAVKAAEPSKEETKPQEKVLSKDAAHLIEELNLARRTASLVCLFTEDQYGKDLTARGAKKIVSDSVKSYMNRVQGLGETVSEKAKACATMFVDEKLWKEISATSEEFGQYVEDTSGVEVILVKVNPQSYSKVKESLAPALPDSTGPLSKEAKTTAESLKEAVKKEDEENKKK